ncbi:MAG: hypothetical protein AAF827_19830 [Cyanobacteria bacterium P01_D01_bin.6]
MESISMMPMKAVMACRVKQSLLKGFDADVQPWPTAFDDRLIKDLTTTLYQSDEYRNRYAACSSKAAAASIAADMVADIATTYRQIEARKQYEHIQQLNDLM